MSDRVITVMGDGQMGLVMADAFHKGGAQVRVWGPFPEDLEHLATTRKTSRLDAFSLDRDIIVEPDVDQAVAGASLLVNAIPTQFIRKVWSGFGSAVGNLPVVSVAKGIENETLLRPTEIITQAIESGGTSAGPQAALSGPTIANELVDHLPAAMVSASLDSELSRQVQAWLQVPWLRIYTHDDLIGVELSGATKNVIALAAGMVDGLGAGRQCQISCPRSWSLGNHRTWRSAGCTGRDLLRGRRCGGSGDDLFQSSWSEPYLWRSHRERHDSGGVHRIIRMRDRRGCNDTIHRDAC